MRILVTDGMDKTAMAELKAQGHEVVEQFYEPAELGKALRDFDVVVVRSKTKVRAAQIDEAKGSNLKLIIRGGVGVDNIDVDYAKAAGIDVKNTPRASSESVAELAMAHMFSCARYISHAGYTMRNGQWEKKAYGKGIELCGKTLGVVGFGRICGVVVGIIANQPNVKAGCLDIDSSDKAAGFIRFCNAFNIPLVNLVDVPGFLPGKNQERGGIIRHGAKLIFAYSQATVPKVTLIMRKAYGGAYIAMCCKDLGADAVFAWPGAEIAVMGAEGAVPVLYGRELKAVEDPAEKAKRQGELLEEYREAFYNPYVAAGMGQITEVINPEETRAKIAFALRTLLNKKEVRPAKKHGNIPL